MNTKIEGSNKMGWTIAAGPQSAIATFLNRDVMTDAMQSKARAEHAALCEVENSLQDVLAWQKTYSNGECRAGDLNDAIADANCALEKLASIRTGK